ncbi:MAG: hypothetical protein HPY74_10730 [Firmicutes bacterium]|nr:hypothetical protein [Bacillota bacterium]
MDVCVEYKIINTSENAMNVKIAFPCDEVSIRGYAKRLAITQDNMVIDYTYTSEIDYYEVFNVDREKFHHFLYNDKKVDFYGYRNPVLILFDISLESNKTSTLKLEYEQYSGFDRNTQFFAYYLQPAKYWNDFKNLSIYIELPENYSFYSNFNFEIKEPNKFNKLYYTHFNELPEDDFYFITERTHISKKVIISLVIAAIIAVVIAITLIIIIKFTRNVSSKKHKKPDAL